MTPFELVFSLITIITSLALTHLLAGFVSLLRNAERVRFSPVHALWAWTALTLTIGDWASYWGLRSLTSWPAWAVLLSVTLAIVQHVFCSFVTPQTPAEGMIDLAAFHRREHRRYILAAGVLFAVALILNFALGGAKYYANWWRDSELSIGGIALTLLALIVRARWAQLLSAATRAALATYFTVISCNVAAA